MIKEIKTEIAGVLKLFLPLHDRKKTSGFLRKKGEGMPVIRNPQFYFKEGFCWTDVLTTHIKCRKKQATVHSTESMSFFSVTDCVPEYYMICIMNSRFTAYFIDSFVNSTSHCTTGDAKLVPILIPTEKLLEKFKSIFDRAIYAQSDELTTALNDIQVELDEAVAELYQVV